MNDALHKKERDGIPVEIRDSLEDLERGIDGLKQTIWCIQAAVQSDAEGSGSYMEGVLSALLLVAKDLADKARSLTRAASESDRAV